MLNLPYQKISYSFLLLLVAATCFGAADLSGSRDIESFERFPGSWILEYQAGDDNENYHLALSAVDRLRRELVFDRSLRISALVTRITYQLPEDVVLSEVVEFFVRQLDQTAYRCAGRDCGRSNEWANQVFKSALLYGPNSNQSYLVGTRNVSDSRELIVVYVIRRGNKRSYVRIEHIRPESPVDLGLDQGLAVRLLSEGVAILKSVQPGPGGVLTTADTTQLAELAAQLSGVTGSQLYLVCHLYGSENAQDLIRKSQQCSEQAAQVMSTAGGVVVVGFGAGPLLPRGEGNRIELVFPSRIDGD